MKSVPFLLAIMSSSRLCVKNIPKNLSEEGLKKHFEAKGDITDVKIIRNRYSCNSSCAHLLNVADWNALQFHWCLPNVWVYRFPQ